MKARGVNLSYTGAVAEKVITHETFSHFIGHMLIQAAINNFWRATKSTGSALHFGRYVNKSAMDW